MTATLVDDDRGTDARQDRRRPRRRVVDFARQAQGSLLSTPWLLTGSGDAAAEMARAALIKTYVAWPKIRTGAAP